MELRRHAQRVVAADRYERVDAVVPQRFDDALDAVPLLGGVRARGAENRTAQRQDAADVRRCELVDEALLQAARPAVLDAAHLISELKGSAGNGAYRGVESGRVATPGEDPDAHGNRLRRTRRDSFDP